MTLEKMNASLNLKKSLHFFYDGGNVIITLRVYTGWVNHQNAHTHKPHKTGKFMVNYDWVALKEIIAFVEY